MVTPSMLTIKTKPWIYSIDKYETSDDYYFINRRNSNMIAGHIEVKIISKEDLDKFFEELKD